MSRYWRSFILALSNSCCSYSWDSIFL